MKCSYIAKIVNFLKIVIFSYPFQNTISKSGLSFRIYFWEIIRIPWFEPFKKTFWVWSSKVLKLFIAFVSNYWLCHRCEKKQTLKLFDSSNIVWKSLNFSWWISSDFFSGAFSCTNIKVISRNAFERINCAKKTFSDLRIPLTLMVVLIFKWIFLDPQITKMKRISRCLP